MTFFESVFNPLLASFSASPLSSSFSSSDDESAMRSFATASRSADSLNDDHCQLEKVWVILFTCTARYDKVVSLLILKNKQEAHSNASLIFFALFTSVSSHVNLTADWARTLFAICNTVCICFRRQAKVYFYFYSFSHYATHFNTFL